MGCPVPLMGAGLKGKPVQIWRGPATVMGSCRTKGHLVALEARLFSLRREFATEKLRRLVRSSAECHLGRRAAMMNLSQENCPVRYTRLPTRIGRW